MYHKESLSHGIVDFSIGKSSDHHFIIVEAKVEDWKKGVAQNQLELECASKVQNSLPVSQDSDAKQCRCVWSSIKRL